jgi:mono/diheme cytochrome c family protein
MMRNEHEGAGAARRNEMIRPAIVVLTLAMTSSALAANAENGRRLAASHCASCHAIAPPRRNELADSPPFELIGRKYGFDADAITHAIAGPHPKMNFSPRPDEAADIAAYISTLGK